MVLQRLYRSTCHRRCTRYCTSSEHPIERCGTTKMKASADELQAIIDEAWKNSEFQEANQYQVALYLKKRCSSGSNIKASSTISPA